MISATILASRVIGCDVGKAGIEVFDSRDGATKTIVNEPAALAAWAAQLDQGCLVICEATGGYEAALLGALLVAGVPAHRADARKVKAFIRSFGILGKTDAIDGRALARYGQDRNAELARWQAPNDARRKLAAMVNARRDLVASHTAFNNRRRAPDAEASQPYLQAVVDCLDAQVKAIDADIQVLIASDKDLDRTNQTLRSITGVGAKTAAALLALMPELGGVDRRKAAALAGLAPHPRQSGATDAYRRVTGGRPGVKRILFMAALTAVKHNKTLREAYQRLLAKAKKPLVALTAIMRKIIVIANARIRDHKRHTAN